MSKKLLCIKIEILIFVIQFDLSDETSPKFYNKITKIVNTYINKKVTMEVKYFYLYFSIKEQ